MKIQNGNMKDVKYVIRENCKPCKKCGSTQRICYPLSKKSGARSGFCRCKLPLLREKAKILNSENVKNLTDSYIKCRINRELANSLKIPYNDVKNFCTISQLDIDVKRQQIIAKRTKWAVKKEIEKQAVKIVAEKIQQHPENIIHSNFNKNNSIINTKNNENKSNENKSNENKNGIGKVGNHRGEYICNGEYGLRFISSPQWWTSVS